MSHLVNTKRTFCHIAPGKHKSFALCDASFIYTVIRPNGTGTYIASTYAAGLLLTLMYLCKKKNFKLVTAEHLTHKLHALHENKPQFYNSGSRSGYSLDERYFPLWDNVSGFRSRWVWTRAQLPQQMTDGGLWNQPLSYDSLTYWSDLAYPVRYCHVPWTRAGHQASVSICVFSDRY